MNFMKQLGARSRRPKALALGAIAAACCSLVSARQRSQRQRDPTTRT